MGIVVPDENSAAQASATAITDFLSEQTGLTIQSRIFPEYPPLLQALGNGTVHFAWLPPFTYLNAHKAGYGDAALVASHFGVYSYGFQILADRASNFNVYYDRLTNKTSSEADIALLQFHEKRPCWVEPLSASGYVIPLGYFNDTGIVLQDGVDTQSHAAVVRAVYVGGICDFGVTYATYGDPRTAESLQTSLPDVLDRVIILWQSDPIIPNLNVSFITDFPGDEKQLIADALIAYAKTDDGKTALSTANDYDIEGLKIIDDSFYEDFTVYADASGVRLYTLMGK